MRRSLSLSVWLGLLACGRVTVDHGASRLVEQDDAGTPADTPAADAGSGPDSCDGRAEGAACDDFDVCTPSSRCQDGQCVGVRDFDDCVVADAYAEFQREQGALGWHYGYWNQTADEDGGYDGDRDFTPMAFCERGNEQLWEPSGRCDTNRDQPGFKWTRVADWALMHPDARTDTELPIRRWVSDVSGPARISVTHEVRGKAGDGTRALLLVDGTELWRHDGGPGDTAPTEASFDVTLRVGTVIDQVLHPVGSSADDMTTFSIKVEGRPGAR